MKFSRHGFIEDEPVPKDGEPTPEQWAACPNNPFPLTVEEMDRQQVRLMDKADEPANCARCGERFKPSDTQAEIIIQSHALVIHADCWRSDDVLA